MSHSIAIEVVQFKLQEKVSDHQFLQLSAQIQAWLQNAPGFLHREVSKGDDGQWLDLIHWRTREEGLTAAQELLNQPCAAEFGTIFDPTSIQMMHLEQKQVFGK